MNTYPRNLAIVGSRSLGSEVAPVVARLVASMSSVTTGCAPGVDRLARAAARSAGIPLSVFSVRQHGGPPSLPLRARLARRTAALVASLPPAAPLVAVLASPSSRGSLLACRLAAARGLPVLALCVGFGGPPAAIGPGAWLPAPVAGLPGWLWQPPPQLCPLS